MIGPMAMAPELCCTALYVLLPVGQTRQDGNREERMPHVRCGGSKESPAKHYYYRCTRACAFRGGLKWVSRKQAVEWQRSPPLQSKRHGLKVATPLNLVQSLAPTYFPTIPPPPSTPPPNKKHEELTRIKVREHEHSGLTRHLAAAMHLHSGHLRRPPRQRFTW